MPWWLLVAVALVAFLATIGTLHYQFVYDDDYQILRNTWIRDWSNVGRIFTTNVWAFTGMQGSSNYYRPLHMLLYTIAYSLGGLKPYAFHLCNILLHSLCCVLVTLVGFRLTNHKFIAVAGGLLFALHPIHAESVAWVAGVTDPLCALFYFSALYFYIRSGDEKENHQSLALCLGAFLLALFSKEMAFTFPVVAAWFDWCLHRRLRWSRYTLFAALFAVYAALRIHALQTFTIQRAGFELDFAQFILNAFVLLARYVTKMFVPYGMSAFHVFMPATLFAPVGILTIACFLILATVAWKIRNQRILIFLLGFGILTIVPVLNLRGIGENVFADRYLYIPTLASCLLVPAGVHALWKGWSARPVWLNARAGAFILALVLVASGWMLLKEMAVWRDNFTLYLETMRRSPQASLIAHNLGRSYFYAGDVQNAQKWEEKAFELWQNSFVKSTHDLMNIYLGLGGVRYQQGKIAEARDYFTKSYQLAPENEAVLQNLGSVEFALRDYGQALQYYAAAIKVNPNSEVSYSNLAAVCLSAGQFDQAIAYAQKALEIYPQFSDACVNLARAYGAKGRKPEAFAAYEKVKAIDPSRAGLADAEMRALAARK